MNNFLKNTCYVSVICMTILFSYNIATKNNHFNWYYHYSYKFEPFKPSIPRKPPESYKRLRIANNQNHYNYRLYNKIPPNKKILVINPRTGEIIKIYKNT